jgi:hypothetical protein
MNKLSSKEKSCKDFIDVAFPQDEPEWVKTAERLNRAMKGKWYKGVPKKARYVINEAFSLVNLILPNFIFNQPYIVVAPNNAKFLKMISNGEIRQRDAIKMAKTMQACINNHYTKTGIIGEDRKAVQDSLIYPFGVCKDGYSFETMTTKDMDYTLKDTGFRKRVNPRDFGYHPMATGPDDSSKLVHRIVMTAEDAEARDIDLDKLEAGIPEYKTKNFRAGDKAKIKDNGEYYTFYEVHDQAGDHVYLYGGENKVLIEKKKRGYDYTESDFSVITFTKDNDEFIGVPMLEMVEPQMVALNEVLTLMMEHLRKFPGQVFMNKDAVDEDQIEKIRTGMQGSTHTVNDINGILRASPLQMGNEYFSILNTLFSIIDRVLGIPDFQRLSGTGRKSATEASFIQGDASVRRNYFLNIVKDFVLSGVRKQSALKQQFQEDKEIIEGTGELNHQIFEFDKRDIQGEYIFNFDVDNMTAYNEAQLNNINNLLMTFSGNPFFAPILARLDPFKAGKKMFSLVKLNYEELSREGIAEEIHMSPEQENEIAASGQLMPRPKDGEHYDYHIGAHKKFIEDRIKEIGPEMAMQDSIVNQLIEHIAETETLKNPMQAMEDKAASQMPAPGPAMGTPGMMQPAGPQGPMTPVEGV